MSELPPSIQELISTPIRKEIFKMVNLQKDGFTFHELYSSLEKKNINVSVTSVQNFLKALHYRGYLKEYALKENKTPGRSTIHYKKLH
ncbi:MAG: transcriptional repressor [Cyclobacteriaceae bacterium]